MATDLARLTSSLTGRYRVERELGSGGMATVYLAHDPRHERRVALKVLRSELAAVIGAERFLHEIKTTANLQHPHILALFDSGEVDGTVFYVMPYVEGESLRDRLNREKQLPVDEAVRIAREVADALDYAHRHGVVHRDIKPENILLHDGRAVVADFGIALAVSRSDTASRMTETGMSLGTPHYMSPEQAMGEREITARSDVYALGCVLYEMLAGEPPFTGPTAQAIVARVVTESPRSLTAQRQTIPPHVDAAVRRALQKLPADRFQTAAQFAAAITTPGTLATDVEATGAPTRRVTAQRILRHPAVPWGLAALLLTVLATVVARGPEEHVGQLRFAADLQPLQAFGPTSAVLVAPDGRTIYVVGFSGQRPVIVSRRLDALEAKVIPGSEGADRPFLSPDGRFLGFAVNGKLMKLPVEGGTPLPIASSSWGGGSWGEDGRIAFNASYKSGISVVSETGSGERQLTTPDSSTNELAHWWPHWLPGGRSLIFTAYRAPISKATIELLDVASGKRTVLVEGGVMGRYLPSGHLVFARDETMLAVPFDAAKGRVTGASVAVLEGVFMNYSDGYASWDASATGTMAYIAAADAGSVVSVVEVDRNGIERPLIAEPDRYAFPRWAPDGRRIALTFRAPRSASDVYVYDPARGSRTRVTSHDASDFGPAWTPDGAELVYISERPLFELYRRSADGTRRESALLTGTHDRIPGAISPNGILAYVFGIPDAPEIWTAPLNDPSKAARYLANNFQLGHPMISPDGKWIAYDSNEGVRHEVFVQSFPDPTRTRIQVSSGGGSEPIWTRGGRELVFRSSDAIKAASIDPQTGSAGNPLTLFTRSYESVANWSVPRSWDASADGSRFLLLKSPAGQTTRRVYVLTDWLDELRQRVPN